MENKGFLQLENYMDFRIRQVLPTDNLALAKMIRNVFIEHNAPQQGTVYSDPTTDHLFEFFQIPKSVLFVAEHDGQPIGCCGIYPTAGLPEKCVELVKFYLPKEARGKGIGKELMEKSIETAIEMGYLQMYLESLPDFSKAISIYEKQGFQRIFKPMANSGHTSCDIWMVKELSS